MNWRSDKDVPSRAWAGIACECLAMGVFFLLLCAVSTVMACMKGLVWLVCLPTTLLAWKRSRLL